MKRKCFSRGKVVIRGELEPYDTYKYSTPGYHSIDFFDPIPFKGFQNNSFTDHLNGLAQKMTKLRKCWAWLNKTFKMQYDLLNDFMCQLKGYSGSQQDSLSWDFAEMTNEFKIPFLTTFITVT